MVRDRHGRGLRGPLASPDLPLARTRREEFDEAVLDAATEIERSWSVDLSGVDFAVVEAPTEPVEDGPDVVADRAIALGRLLRSGEPGTNAGRPMVLVYRRPLETRTQRGGDRRHTVLHVVADLLAELLGRDPG